MGQLQKVFKFISVLLESGADSGLDFPAQFGVALQQPAAEGNAVGFVVELLRIQAGKVCQLAVLQNFRVQGGHAVGGVGEVDIHVSHVNTAVTIQNSGAGILCAGTGQIVQLMDNGHQLGDHSFQIVAGPFFKCLCQNGVVGIGAGIGDDLDCLIKGNTLFAQQADQLGNNHAGMGVIDLNGGVIGQIVVVAAPRGALGQNQLGTGADHQILLVDAQHPTGLIGVVGVEEESQVFVDLALVKEDVVF